MSDSSDVRPARPVKVGHLVMGAIFLGIVVIWALGTNGTVDWGASGYLAPAILVGAGVLGLAASVLPRRRRTPVTAGHATSGLPAYDASRAMGGETGDDIGEDPTIRIDDDTPNDVPNDLPDDPTDDPANDKEADK